MQATKKVDKLNAILKKLEDKRERSKKHKMAEYRCNLKTATVQSLKCMYEEYIKRKQNTLAGHKADACFKEINLGELITPSKVSSSVSRSHVTDERDVSNSPLAVPLE